MPKKRKRTARGAASDQTWPDVSKWNPKPHPSQSLQNAFFQRCKYTEQHIINRVLYEKQHNEHNFDSGWSIEEIVRSTLRELLPKRYSVEAGSVSDSKGYSAGDCDVVIFNDFWFPKIKVGPTPESRKAYMPIEGVYSILEIKQTLTVKALDEAMHKLVSCHRLFRPYSSIDRLVENDTRSACTHYVSNPLHSAILATDLQPGLDRDKIVERFIRINQSLPRTDIVNSLCILGHGTVVWGYGEDSELDPRRRHLHAATLMGKDRYSELVPIYAQVDPKDSPFFELVRDLLAHLTDIVLAPENLAVHYGSRDARIQVPYTPGATLVPDDNLLATLNESCSGKDRTTDSSYHDHDSRRG